MKRVRPVSPAALVLCLALAACASPRPLTPALTPTPSVKTDRIAFVADGQIYTIRTDGQELENLTPGDKTNEQPTWSPDGKLIGFVGFGFKQATLFLMNADGSERHAVQHADGVLTPSWGPDAGHITYWGNADKQSDILQLDMQSLQVTRLTDDAPVDTFPVWSPNRKTIAFVSNRSANGLYQIYALDVATHGITALTEGAFVNNEPAWSPDGSRIAYSCGSARGPGVCMMMADGSDKSYLVDPAKNEYGSHPSWSPDGARLVFQSIEGQGRLSDLYIIYADGSGRTRVTDVAQMGLGSPHQPVWQPTVR